jgi:FkbM family methyltransferase
VYTFEPDPLSFFCLTNNCQFDNIIKFNAALGDKNGLIKVKEFHPDNRGMNRVEPTTDIAHSIPIVAIDNFELQDVKLIQLDLEGYEIPAIKGALKTIKKHKPVMILECGDEINPDDAPHRTQLVDMMESIGYSMHRSLGRLDIAFLPRNRGDR